MVNRHPEKSVIERISYYGWRMNEPPVNLTSCCLSSPAVCQNWKRHSAVSLIDDTLSWSQTPSHLNTHGPELAGKFPLWRGTFS